MILSPQEEFLNNHIEKFEEQLVIERAKVQFVSKLAKYQYAEILKFDKKIGTTIVNFLKMEDVNE